MKTMPGSLHISLPKKSSVFHEYKQRQSEETFPFRGCVFFGGRTHSLKKERTMFLSSEASSAGEVKKIVQIPLCRHHSGPMKLFGRHNPISHIDLQLKVAWYLS